MGRWVLQEIIKSALLLGAVDMKLGGMDHLPGGGARPRPSWRGACTRCCRPSEIVEGSFANADPSCPEE